MSASDKKLPLVELFGPTIQGEGAVIGQQTYFMRFGLCDYKCKMCDSMNAVDPIQVKQNARFLTQAQILEEFLTKHYIEGSARCVTLSGGNPCIHDLTEIVSNLRGHGFKVVVETQGTFKPLWLLDCDTITISPKGPGMGENTDLAVLDDFMDEIAPYANCNIKVVVFDQRDLEFASMLYERYYDKYKLEHYLSLGNPYPPGTTIGKDSRPSFHQVHINTLLGRYKMLFEDIQCDPILSRMRLLPQWHVFLWGNEKGK